MEHFSLKPKHLQLIALIHSYSKTHLSIRQIARLLSWPPSTTSRLVKSLENLGLIQANYQSQLKLIQLNPNHPSYQEILQLALKNYGLPQNIKKILETFPYISSATIYGSTALHQLDDQSDLDLLLVGQANQNQLNQKFNQLEEQFGRPINYSLYSSSEFSHQKQHSPFLQHILKQPTIKII